MLSIPVIEKELSQSWSTTLPIPPGTNVIARAEERLVSRDFEGALSDTLETIVFTRCLPPSAQLQRSLLFRCLSVAIQALYESHRYKEASEVIPRVCGGDWSAVPSVLLLLHAKVCVAAEDPQRARDVCLYIMRTYPRTLEANQALETLLFVTFPTPKDAWLYASHASNRPMLEGSCTPATVEKCLEILMEQQQKLKELNNSTSNPTTSIAPTTTTASA
eukprot:PhF_6_TR22217/c0_g1_i1/m.31371